MNLQHNITTNGIDYTSIFGGDTKAFITQYQGAGKWDAGSVGTFITGSVAGSVIHSRGFSINSGAAECDNPKGWFTKSSDLEKPLSTLFINLTGVVTDCKSELKWITTDESDVSYYELQQSPDGSVFTILSKFLPKGNNSTYDFLDNSALQGGIYYRLKIVDNANKFTYSNVLPLINCTNNLVISVYPNPVVDKVTVSGLDRNCRNKIIDNFGSGTYTNYTDKQHTRNKYDIPAR